MLSSVHKQNFFEFKMHFIVCLSLSSTAQVKMDLGDQIPVNGCPLMTNWQLLTNQVIQKIMKKRYNVHVSQPQKISWSKLEGKMKKRKKSLSIQIFVLIIFSSSHVYCLNMFFDGIRLTYIEDRNLCTFSTNLWFKICCWKMLPNLRHICSTHLFCAHQEKHVLNVSSMTKNTVQILPQ